MAEKKEKVTEKKATQKKGKTVETVEAVNAMEEEKFQEKLQELLAIAKKKKNVIEDNEIIACFASSRDVELTTERMVEIFDFLEQNKVDVLTISDEDDEPDDDALLDVENEEEISIERIDLSVPEGTNIEDPVRMYLKEIGKVPLLSADEEIALAQKMEAGDMAKNQLDEDEGSLDEAQKKELQALVKQGDYAKKKLAEANCVLDIICV